MTDLTITQNAAKCIEHSWSIGGQTAVNVCNGMSTWVPWGSLDWLGFVASGVAIAAMVLVGGAIFIAATINT